MIIFWQNSMKDPRENDIKVLKSGEVFVRKQQRHGNCWVVSNGRECYEWVPYIRAVREQGIFFNNRTYYHGEDRRKQLVYSIKFNSLEEIQDAAKLRSK